MQKQESEYTTRSGTLHATSRCAHYANLEIYNIMKIICEKCNAVFFSEEFTDGVICPTCGNLISMKDDSDHKNSSDEINSEYKTPKRKSTTLYVILVLLSLAFSFYKYVNIINKKSNRPIVESPRIEDCGNGLSVYYPAKIYESSDISDRENEQLQENFENYFIKKGHNNDLVVIANTCKLKPKTEMDLKAFKDYMMSNLVAFSDIHSEEYV